MRILLASSEVAPFAKTGGLADVCGALPIEFTKLGHRTTVFMPAYRQVYQAGRKIERLDILFDIPIGSKIVTGRLLRCWLPGDVPVYLVEQEDYFDRPELYREAAEDYKDNCERFAFFCRAVLESIRKLDLQIDVLHCNDWQTALIPAYLNIEYHHAAGYANIATLLTIHNLAFQGTFWHWDMLLTGLDWKYFNWRQMEFFGQLNLLKTGLVFADALNTVSPRYALEIQTPELGWGLEGVLQQRSNVLSGIINGVSYEHWNPATDPHLAANYDVENWETGKAACKAALQKEFGLPESPSTPLIGLVGRLSDQKGLNLVSDVMQRWAPAQDMQWVILGTGELKYHDILSRLAKTWPEKISVTLGFSEELAHRIEAGADMFLMPSQYEPCGLNQLYSLKYGTVPVVRATGGLADTITDATPENLQAGTANGFSFGPFDAAALEDSLRRACGTYRDKRDVWSKLVTTGMRQDWSWASSARQYVKLYEKILSDRKQARLVV